MATTSRRVFTARLGDLAVTITPTSVNPYWWAVRYEGVTVGLLGAEGSSGFLPLHPEDFPKAGRPVLFKGRVLGDHRYAKVEVLNLLGGMVTGVADATPPCSDWAFAKLLAAVRTFARSQYHDGHLSEGEAWSQCVLMPANMAGLACVEITAPDLRRALIAAGWSRRARGDWYEK